MQNCACKKRLTCVPVLLTVEVCRLSAECAINKKSWNLYFRNNAKCAIPPFLLSGGTLHLTVSRDHRTLTFVPTKELNTQTIVNLQTPSSSPQLHCIDSENYEPKGLKQAGCPRRCSIKLTSTSCYQTGQCVSQPAFKIFCQCRRRCNTRHFLSRPILALQAIPVRPRLPSYPTRHPSCNAAVWKKLSAGLWTTTMPQSLACQHQLQAEKLTRVTLPFGAHPSRQM